MVCCLTQVPIALNKKKNLKKNFFYCKLSTLAWLLGRHTSLDSLRARSPYVSADCGNYSKPFAKTDPVAGDERMSDGTNGIPVF